MKITFIRKTFEMESNHVFCYLEYICFHGHFTVIGKATCNKEDKFDANIGMKIALAKAEMKAYHSANKTAKVIYEQYKAKMNETKEFIDKATHCIEHNKEYIKKISE